MNYFFFTIPHSHSQIRGKGSPCESGSSVKQPYLKFGNFSVQTLQGGHLSKEDKNFCPVSVRFKEVPLYMKNAKSSQPCISMNFCTEFSKAWVFLCEYR